MANCLHFHTSSQFPFNAQSQQISIINNKERKLIMQWFNTPWEQEINSTSLILMEWRQVNDALSEQYKNVVNYSVLNPLMTLMSFRYPPWKHKKIRCFLVISGVWKETLHQSFTNTANVPGNFTLILFLNLFHATFLFLYPLKTSENFLFSKKPVISIGLRHCKVARKN